MEFLLKGVLLLVLCHSTLAENKANPGELHQIPEYLDPIWDFDKTVADALTEISPEDIHANRYIHSYGWYITDVNSIGNGDRHHPHVMHHPLHKYALIKRLVLYYPRFKQIFYQIEDKLMKENLKNEHTKQKDIKRAQMMKAVRDAENTTVLPNEKDLMGVADTIGYLQKLYRLPLEDMIFGRIMNYSTSVVLNDWDCVRIGRANVLNERWSGAWLWYSIVRRSTTNPEMAIHVDELLDDVMKMHDSNWQNDDNHFDHLLSKKKYQIPRSSTFSEACSKTYKSESPDVKCELTTMGQPYFLLQPIKLELVHKSPDFWMYHNILTDFEMDTLKGLTKGNMIKDARKHRITNYAFVNDDFNIVTETIVRKVALMTGLKTDDGSGDGTIPDPIKLRHYASGGHINPHYDVRIKIPNRKGNYSLGEYGDRMTSVIFYLNDVVEGGHTAFYNLDVSIKPERGSAIVWHNLKKNGVFDHLAEHGGCPIVIGTKWVAIKWIREFWNFQTRPCSLDPDE